MELFEAIERRRSVRAYKSEVPQADLLYQVVEAARLAPSACNKQPWRFYVVTDKDILGELAKSYDREWFATAPSVIVVAGNHSDSWHRADGKDHCDVDVAIAAEHIALAAAALELGTCWVCNFDVQKVTQVLDIEQGWEPIVLLPIGFPADDAAEREINRKPIEDVARFLM